MEKLRSKTFYTIFSIISSFILLVIIFFNIQNYQKEYKGIENNLIRMNEFINNIPKVDDKKKENNKELPNNDLNNRIIMDYNFYTILLDDNNNIIDKISHNGKDYLSDDVLKSANNIIASSKNSEIKIKSLYFSNIAYNLKLGNYLIIVDTSNIKQRLLSMLFLSIIVLFLSFVLVYYFSKKITDWITKPVEISFNNQKEFIANASHELKTPLSVIIASIDCITPSRKNEKWLNNLKTESDRMSNLITRLLDLSKTENSLNKESHVLNNLSKIVEKRALTFESLAYENKLKIECNITSNIMFKCNQNEIDELVGVIIDNAIKHSFSSSIVKVNLYKEKNNNIVLDIINNGEEIPLNERNKIFERFYRSDKSRNRASGRYGLGLAIAKNIVNNHSGNIEVICQNNYTTFRITFKYKNIK